VKEEFPNAGDSESRAIEDLPMLPEQRGILTKWTSVELTSSPRCIGLPRRIATNSFKPVGSLALFESRCTSVVPTYLANRMSCARGESNCVVEPWGTDIGSIEVIKFEGDVLKIKVAPKASH
jgi:hypothetical protein